ncbi:MAG: alpha/beta fold hydrolase, partial [Hyphomicrobiaceae bacterium]
MMNADAFGNESERVVGPVQAPLVREIARPGRRVLGLCEFGDPHGFPVLAFHGNPGSRLMFRPANTIAQQLGLRLIAPDRPGTGASTIQPDRILSDWTKDVEAVLVACNIDRFALLGVSGGGPFSVASAAYFGKRVCAQTLIGPV